jgi:hypothetical protein
MISRTQLKDSDYSDDGSDVTIEDRSLRLPKTQEPKQEKHQMASRQDYASTKRLKNESFEYMDFTLDYKSPPEDFGEITHEKQY